MIDRRAFIGAGAATAVTPLIGCTIGERRGPLTFVAVGDFGRDGTEHQREVGVQMGVEAQRIQSQFALTVGDNFYDNGVQSVTDPKWRTSFEDIYDAPSLQTPWFGVLGNHDYRGNVQAQLDYGKTSRRWRMPKRYYMESVRGDGVEVDLFFLDTSPMVRRYGNDEDAAIRQAVASQDVRAQLAWLDAKLRASRAPWKLVFGHHPVYSGGKHGDTPELVSDVRPIFERHGVQAYINGHDHDLQHIEREGVAYVCSGAGSETRPVKTMDGTRFCIDRSGFTSYEVARDVLRINFRDYTGTVLHTADIPRARAPAKSAA